MTKDQLEAEVLEQLKPEHVTLIVSSDLDGLNERALYSQNGKLRALKFTSVDQSLPEDSFYLSSKTPAELSVSGPTGIKGLNRDIDKFIRSGALGALAKKK